MQRKQARTDAEREDDEEEHFSDSDSDGDDDEVIYNPKNLPLGWDGKVSTLCIGIISGLCSNLSPNLESC